MEVVNDRDRSDLLKAEYLLLQNHYEDFDKRTLTIKGWIAAGATAALAIPFGNNSKHAYFVPISIMIIAASFWYLEAHWKVFQDAIGDRIRIIEAYFRANSDILDRNPFPFQAYYQFSISYEDDKPIYRKVSGQPEEERGRSKYRRLAKKASESYVFMPYAVIFVLSLAEIVILLVTSH
jgi:hypothetical protein